MLKCSCLTSGKIYIPSVCEKTIQFAADELQLHIKKICGSDIKIADGNADSSEQGFIFKVRPESDWKGRESSQAFSIEQTLEPSSTVIITGNTGLAVLYGVYQYLNDLDVRWFAPGEIGTQIPEMSEIPVNPGKRNYTPSFASLVMALSSTEDNHFGGSKDIQKDTYDYQLYLLRNRTQFARNIAGKDFDFNLSVTGTGHRVKPMTGLTEEEVKDGLMDREPERFALVTGDDFIQKRRYEGGQVCFTNEKNIQTAIKNCIAYFESLAADKGTRNTDLDEDAVVPMGLSDCFGMCECEDCKRVAGNGSDKHDRLVWNFWNKIARGLAEKLPGRKMVVHSPYMDLTHPPENIKVEPNIMVVTCLVNSWEKGPENKETYPFPKRYYNNIARIKKAGAILGNYDYQNFPWTPTPLHILETVKGYANLGYKHYHLESMQRSEYEWPLLWSLAQYTWSTEKEPVKYLEKFCHEYYGESCGSEVLWILQEMTRNALKMQRLNYGASADSSAMFPDKFIAAARKFLKSTAGQDQAPQYKERIRKFSIAIEAQFQLAEVYRAYCKALNSRNSEDIEAFKSHAENLQKFWHKNSIEEMSSTFRTAEVAAGIHLETDFAALQPVTRKELKGKGPEDKIWLQELFAGTVVPDNISDFFPLPEIWNFRIDYDNCGLDEGYFKEEFDDSSGWQALSSWDFPQQQGYKFIGGNFWYRLNFTAPVFSEGKKVFLRIGSLDDSGDVYLNGIKIGSQPYPENWDKSFAMEVTDVVRQGRENVLAVHGYDSGGGEGVWRPSAIYTD